MPPKDRLKSIPTTELSFSVWQSAPQRQSIPAHFLQLGKHQKVIAVTKS
jgi:hypothetical protein